MPALPRSLLAALCAAALGSGGCTLAKPLVGAVTGPIVMLGHSNGSFAGCGCDDGRGVVVLFGLMSVAGACAGLVTGIVSDVQCLTGDVYDPCRNWWDPFATNTSR